MREKLTEKDVILLETFANNDMKMRPTAEELHYHRYTVFKKLCEVYEKTGRDPRTFWGLSYIMWRIEEERQGVWTDEQ